VVSRHREVPAVADALTQRSEEHAVVVTDAVFSVDGELAPLRELHTVVRRLGAVLIVDEAHALGVVGPQGRGAVESCGLAGEPDIIVTATLSKALGSQGGVLLASETVVDHLVDAGRAFIFDTGLAPACAGAALAALGVVASTPRLAPDVRARARDLAALAGDATGLPVTLPEAAVVSVLVGSPKDAVAAAAGCADHGVRVGCFRPPSVPDGISRLRLTARADLTDADLEVAATALRHVRGALTRSRDMSGVPSPGPIE
jgi:8-amino-7-oxononanoate synthase